MFEDSDQAKPHLKVVEDSESQIEVQEFEFEEGVSEIFLESAADRIAAENEETIAAPKRDSKKIESTEPDTDVVITALEIFRNGESRQVFKIPEGEPRIMIGRSEDSELRLKSEFVSRHHALIVRADDGLYVEDLNSFNGTVVNSKKISRHKLLPTDTIMIGKFEIRPKTA